MKKIYSLSLILFVFVLFKANSQTSTWAPLTSGTTANLLGVSAPSSNICYVAGGTGVILKTANGGTLWSPQNSGTTQTLYDIHFTDTNTGYAVGDNFAAIKTINGGITWSPMTIPSFVSAAFRQIYFFDSNTGFIVGGTSGMTGIILKTIDAGSTWTDISPSSASVYSIYFTSSTIGYANANDGKIYKTTDGGTTWNFVSSGMAGPLNGTMQFTSSTTGFVVATNGTIRTTANSGATWSGVSSGTTNDLMGLDFLNANTGFIVGGNATNNTGIILNTINGGTTWTTYTPGTSRLYRVDYLNANTAYVVGLNGTILKYTSNVGILENEYSTFKSYPNPFTTSTTIELKTQLLPATVCINVYDIAGKLVCSSTLEVSEHSVVFERNQLVAGIYFYKLSDNNKIIENGKFVIQ